MRKYQDWFNIVETMKEAEYIMREYNETATRWQKKKYPAHVTDWQDDANNKYFVVWTSR